MRLKLARR